MGGLACRKDRIIRSGMVWGTDFVLSDVSLMESPNTFALTYVEIMCLDRQTFMMLVEFHRETCPLVVERVRRFQVRLAVRRGIMLEAHRRLALLAEQKSKKRTVTPAEQ